MNSAAPVGFFGKLPCNGDFLQRRVPQEFVDHWDAWLQQCIQESRQALQDGWLNAYLSGPVWRFVLSEGVCGSGAYAGVMMPSVDRVGRYFPLTIVTQLDSDDSPLEVACRGAPWFVAAEELALAALDDANLNLDGFDDSVEALAARLPASTAEQSRLLTTAQDQSGFPAQGWQWHVTLPGANELQSAVNALALRVLAGQLRPLTLWWTEGASALGPACLALRGLPAPSSFAAMFAGHWEHWGWKSAGAQFAQAASAPPTGFNGAPGDIAHAAPLAPAREAAESDAIVVHADAPTSRPTAIEENGAAYISRPEIGLWAIAAGNGADDARALEMIADLLNQLPDAASLSALVESARSALWQGHEHIRLQAARDVQRADPRANALVMLAKGQECALLTAGAVQLLRARDHALHAIIDSSAAEPLTSTPKQAAAGDSLMDLFRSEPRVAPPLGAEGLEGIAVHYDLMMPGDHWILCGRPLVNANGWSRIASLVASGLPLNALALGDSLRESDVAVEAQTRPLPVLLLEVNTGHGLTG